MLTDRDRTMLTVGAVVGAGVLFVAGRFWLRRRRGMARELRARASLIEAQVAAAQLAVNLGRVGVA